jgi:hypothetical protein
MLHFQLSFAQTYASCIDQPCMDLLPALFDTINFVVMSAHSTSARDKAPLPSQPKYVRIDDTTRLVSLTPQKGI